MPELFAAAFYRFTPLLEYQALRSALTSLAEELELKGTILLAPEGINGTLSGRRATLEAFFARLGTVDERLADLPRKYSPITERPFLRLKVKLKREIVTLGIPSLDPASRTGRHVAPQDWNALIRDPQTVLLDTRNRYEVATGTFQRAIDPELERFRDFPQFVEQRLDPDRDKKVAMFCTGGIRCEKAAAYLLEQGFEEVYQLQGGILQYLEDVPPEESLWSGECFVFDERVTVGHDLKPGQHSSCRACRHPLSAEDRASSDYREGVYCPRCRGQDPAREARAAARWRQVELARARGREHLGIPTEAQREDAAKDNGGYPGNK